jgi:hypothetical protein
MGRPRAQSPTGVARASATCLRRNALHRKTTLAIIAIAQEYSARACLDSGGRPRPTTGQQRGSCRSESMQDPGGGVLYRCYGEAAIWCR